MKRGTLIAVLLLALAPAGRAIAQADLGEPFTLAPGESIAVGTYGLVVGFTGILSDSRCPTGVICVWEGDAVASLWADTPASPAAVPFELHTCYSEGAGFCHQTADVLAYHFRLQDVSPYPVPDVPIPPESYGVTLVVTALEVAGGTGTWGTVKGLYR